MAFEQRGLLPRASVVLRHDHCIPTFRKGKPIPGYSFSGNEPVCRHIVSRGPFRRSLEPVFHYLVLAHRASLLKPVHCWRWTVAADRSGAVPHTRWLHEAVC